MCGRYFIEKVDSEEMRLFIDIMNRAPHPENVKLSGEIFPSDTALVVASSLDNKPKPRAMSRGYLMDMSRRVINARCETAQEKRLFSDDLRARRCVVPASGFYEWRRDGHRTKYAIWSDQPGMMYMAGLYRQGNLGSEFVILTRESEGNMRSLHDRMPVILPSSHVRGWLNQALSMEDALGDSLTDVNLRPVEPEQLSFL